MVKSSGFGIDNAFRNYKDVVFSVGTDIDFWGSALDNLVSSYQKQPPRTLYEAMFALYNVPSVGDEGVLASFSKTISISSSNLPAQKQLFLTWAVNLAILKLYTSVETFLLQAIWLRHYPHLKNPTLNKKASDQLKANILKYLTDQGVSTDSKNNRSLIIYLRETSTDVNLFLDQRMRTDLSTDWLNFFELFSALRNIIAHQGTIVSQDSKNEIQGKAKDVFKRHFILEKDNEGNLHLKADIGQFGNFIGFVNDFTVNIVKFLFDQRDFSFLDMQS